MLRFRTWLGAMRRVKCDFLDRHRARAGTAAQQIKRSINSGAVEIAARAGRQINFLFASHESEKNGLKNVLSIHGVTGDAICGTVNMVVVLPKESFDLVGRT